jgi:3-oxoacyl-[acyl-carrier protein] reductase
VSNGKKYALVTGGSRGIGKAICIGLAGELGYHVLINYVSNEAAALETLEEVKAAGGTGEIIKFSVADYSEVETAINQWRANNPGITFEVLVNNAGITKDGLLLWMTEEHWDSVLDTSLKGFYNVTRQIIPEMVKTRYGRIINVVSLSGLKGMAGQVNYSAAKGGVIAATKALAQEVSKRKITVNAVAPGFIDTDMTKDLPKEDLVKMVPAGRFGQAKEVADLVVFLASNKAAYITGEVININGGLYS